MLSAKGVPFIGVFEPEVGKEKVGFDLVSEAGLLVVGGSAKMVGAVPLALVVISFFSGLEEEGWLKEARDL